MGVAVGVSGARPVMIVAMRGDEELGFRAADLAGRLPEALAPLARIAYNYRWRWYPGGKEVFRSIDPESVGAVRRESRFGCCRRSRVRRLARAAGDRALLDGIASLEDAFAVDLGRASVGPVGAGASDRVLLRGVRRAPVVADLLGRARCAGGRPAQGGFGSSVAAGGRRPDVSPGVFPSAPGRLGLAA